MRTVRTPFDGVAEDLANLLDLRREIAECDGIGFCEECGSPCHLYDEVHADEEPEGFMLDPSVLRGGMYIA